ncbi:hypothetical protein JL107_01830 [Nakamurella flavida]|uniref:Uncharacterized protein n=1 Tax=Nakamurella flavida TaxID=363630 RepID=A0A938YCK9_9ACTN|nr:hypothetical protein [Nakamurella flavida]MBM9475175.1 hypothetical protein [Nakamurella flavida]MDP9776748.1 hypothetical protein [Nakamurella flavida]
MRLSPHRTVVWAVVLFVAAVGALSALFHSWQFVAQMAGTFLVVRFALWWRDRPVRRLSPRGQERFAAVMRTGEPSGDPIIDRLAIRRLRQDAKDTPRSQRVVAMLGLAAAAGIEVAAAIVRTPVWAVAAVASAVTLLFVARRPPASAHPAEGRYERLLAGTPPHIH